jgi:hypothetical protein
MVQPNAPVEIYQLHLLLLRINPPIWRRLHVRSNSSGGACASPPEDCGGPKAYMEKIDHHHWNPPLDELQLIADAVGRVLDSKGHERIRDVLGDIDALQEAVDRLETYEQFRPGRFNRRKLNRRLKQYAQGDEEWLWE